MPDTFEKIKTEKTPKAKPPHSGHRQRLYDRAAEGDLSEHEQLELLLFNAVARINTNDLAHRLLSRFGTLWQVLTASVEELQTVNGVGKNIAVYLHSLGKVCKNQVQITSLAFSGHVFAKDFLLYAKEQCDAFPMEIVDVYMLDADGRIIGQKRFQGANSEQVIIDPAELASALLNVMPAGIVLVHSHPEGEAKASRHDVIMTKKCQLICSSCNVMFCDHIIFGKDGIYSFYKSGKLQKISKDYSIEWLTEQEGGLL